mgnify:CR=1 FL=1
MHSKSLFLALGFIVFLTGCTSVPLDENRGPVGIDQTNPDEATPSLPERPSVPAKKCMAPNMDKPDSVVTYRSAQYGMQFDIPYNKKWGFTGTPLQSYVESEAEGQLMVQFGPPMFEPAHDGRSDSCDLVHAYNLVFLSAKPVEAVIRDIETQDSLVVPTTQTKVINGQTVVQFTDAGLNKNPTIIVIGTKFNYRFSTMYGDDTPEEWAFLEGVVQTVRLAK